MSVLVAIILASLAESLTSFFAGVAVIVNEIRVRKFVHWVISFAVGVLLGVVFLDLLPETFEVFGDIEGALIWVLVGFLLFFVFERFLLWFHRHEEDRGTAGYLVLFGDAVHNFIDGVIIAIAFLTDFGLGVATSIAVILHEIPQEVSDFTIMLHSGFTRGRAMFFNVLVSVTSIIGALAGYALAGEIGFIGILLAIVAGNFLYLAASDLIPELHRAHKSTSAVGEIFLTLAGIFLMYYLGVLFPE